MTRPKLALLPFAAVTFMLVSGGSYGLEPVVSLSGPGMALLLILLVPILWAIPETLITAELTGMMPKVGGFYEWVSEALGRPYGFLCAWWTWLYSMVDAAMYPVLVVEYTAQTVLALTGSELAPGVAVVLKVALIGLCTILNFRGVKLVGRTMMTLALLVLVPFLVMIFAGTFRTGLPTQMPLVHGDQSPYQAFVSGLYVVIWNYLGWDNMSTVAEDVEAPGRTYLRGFWFALPVMTAVYFFTVWVGLGVLKDPAEWVEGVWPAIAEAVGGKALFWGVTLGALAGLTGMFVGQAFSSARLPFVLARDGFLPGFLSREHPRFFTPHRAILFLGAVYLALALNQSFLELVTVNVILYTAAIVLEIVALWVFRIRRPDAERPVRIGGGWVGLALVSISPVLLVGLAVWQSVLEEGWSSQGLTLAFLVSGPVVLGLRRLAGKKG